MFAKKTVNYLRFISKLWKPLKGSSVNQHLPSAPHDWSKQKGSKTKIQQRGDMNNTKLNESLENIFTIRRDVWE